MPGVPVYRYYLLWPQDFIIAAVVVVVAVAVIVIVLLVVVVVVILIAFVISILLVAAAAAAVVVVVVVVDTTTYFGLFGFLRLESHGSRLPGVLQLQETHHSEVQLSSQGLVNQWRSWASSDVGRILLTT